MAFTGNEMYPINTIHFFHIIGFTTRGKAPVKIIVIVMPLARMQLREIGLLIDLSMPAKVEHALRPV